MKKVFGSFLTGIFVISIIMSIWMPTSAKAATAVINNYEDLTAGDTLSHNSNEVKITVSEDGFKGSKGMKLTPKYGVDTASMGNVTFWGDYASYFFGSALEGSYADLTGYDYLMFYMDSKNDVTDLQLSFNEAEHNGQNYWLYLTHACKLYDVSGKEVTDQYYMEANDTEMKLRLGANFKGWMVIPLGMGTTMADTENGLYCKDGTVIPLDKVKQFTVWGNEKTELTIDEVTLVVGDYSIPDAGDDDNSSDNSSDSSSDNSNDNSNDSSSGNSSNSSNDSNQENPAPNTGVGFGVCTLALLMTSSVVVILASKKRNC